MSRHRIVKNLDLDDEMDDRAIDSGGEDYDDMTEVQQVQMSSGLTAVHAVLGSSTSITDREIRSALWDFYFDVDGSVAFLLDELHKKEAAKARAEGADSTPTTLAEPPTDSLASLTLSAVASEPPPPPPPATKTSKLGAKMAANRAAKAAPPAAPPAAPTPAAEEAGGKKLSKLQLKMLAAKQARASASSSSPAAPPPPPVVEPEPNPEPIPVAQPEPLFPSLAAPPSLFASSLLPSSLFPPPRASPALRKDEARRIEQSLLFSSGAGGGGSGGGWGLSPDDKVLEARMGTALGAGVGVVRRK